MDPFKSKMLSALIRPSSAELKEFDVSSTVVDNGGLQKSAGYRS